MKENNSSEQKPQKDSEEKYWPVNPEAERIKKLIRDGKSPVIDLGPLKDDEKKKHDPENPPDDDDPIRYAPWLVISSFLGDIGNRPLSVPFWVSPSIWLETYQPTGGSGQLVPIPQVGQSYQVAVRVDNRGYASSYGTIVEFYWGDPSTNVNAGVLNSIGAPVSIVVPAGGSAIARSGFWVPIWVNNGHECLIVRAYDPVFDPIDPASFHPAFDRHVGQANLGVVQAPAGTHAFTFVQVHNPTKSSLQLRLVVEPLAVEAILAHANRLQLKGKSADHHLLYFGLITRDWHFKGEPVSRPQEEEKEKLGNTASQPEHYPQFSLPRSIDLQLARALEPVIELTMKPKESRRIEVAAAIPYAAKPGELYGLRIVQHEKECIIGAVDRLILVV